MRTLRFVFAIGCGLAVAASAQAAGKVEVAFAAPFSYTDLGRDVSDAEANRQQLSAWLQDLGRRHLQANEVLQIEVLDARLAGNLRPAPATPTGQVRIARGGADYPRIKLRYTLLADGKPVQRGEETVADLNYLRDSPAKRIDDPLAHEKRMLARWFKARFVEHQPATG
jgi:hypothetical protein